MNSKYYLIGLVFFLWLMIYSMAQADEVKYFAYNDGDATDFKFNGADQFSDEIQGNDLSRTWFHFEVHYKNGKKIKAFRIAPRKYYGWYRGHKFKTYKIEYDSDERVKTFTMNPDNIIVAEKPPPSYELCKSVYGKQIREDRCYNINGEFTNKAIFNYKYNLLVKTSLYDESERLTRYWTYDYETGEEKAFTEDHELIRTSTNGYFLRYK